MFTAWTRLSRAQRNTIGLIAGAVALGQGLKVRRRNENYDL